MYRILDKIKSPADVKTLSDLQLDVLASEVRTELIDTVSQTGGHLASNLGVVELTIALHRVFDSPTDQIVWDVGHQVYTHKLLTGRLNEFKTLRTKGGISGYPCPRESEHDIMYAGHSSASISAAYGLAVAKKINNEPGFAISVIGDGSFTGGLAYEGLNNAGRSGTKLIVILNDNEMSISENVGSMARYLAAIRTKPEYYTFVQEFESSLKKAPCGGEKLFKLYNKVKTDLKNNLYQSTLFEDMGFKYLGPIDGHDINALTEALEGAKALESPVLLHINTIKGKGYNFAEKHPTTFHGISQFDIETGEKIYSSPSFSSVYGDYMCEIGEKNEKVCAVTAAMAVGTGLEKFSKKFPNRFFDVGLAEEHAVTFCGGLSKNGMIPVFAVYSTFLQRCYDQLVHDASLQRQKLVLCVDRAGFVGEDGETHQGFLDIAFMNTIPNITVYSPSSFIEMKYFIDKAVNEHVGITAVRFPRGRELYLPDDFEFNYENYQVYGDKDSDIAIVTFGRLFSNACKAYESLKSKGIKAKIIKLNKIKPIDENAVLEAMKCSEIYFFEEGVKTGGCGEVFGYKLLEKEYKGNYNLRAINDCFVEHSTIAELIEKYGFDSESMVKLITGRV